MDRRINPRRGGFTLVEMMVACGLGTIVLTAVMSYSLFTARSFYAVGNYVDLDMNSRNALDVMSRDIRQANGCSTNAGGFTATSLTLMMTDPTSGSAYTVNYNYDTNAQAMFRTSTRTGASQTTMLLTNCSAFALSYYQRNPTNGVWSAFPLDLTQANQCKLVQIDWTCARSVLGSLINSESMESAKVVIRN